MSTFLQLAQALRRETTDSGTGPYTVVGQSGEAGRMVSWVADSWTELQQDRLEWLWMRRGFSVNTADGVDTYAYTDCKDLISTLPIARFSRWYEGADENGWPWMQAYRQSEGVGSEFPLLWLPWDYFRRLYRIGTQNNAQPVHVTTDPQQRLVIGPKPDGVYVVTGEYQIGPQVMTLDSDIPEMPSRFHMLIVYEAMAKYGGNRIAPEAVVRAVSEGGRLRAALEQDQLPRITMGPSLA